MKKKWKIRICLLMSALLLNLLPGQGGMLLTTVLGEPSTVYAEEAISNYGVRDTSSGGADNNDGNVNYYSTNDVLEISGTGVIATERYSRNVNIKKVVIGEGITGIIENAFNETSNLTTVEFEAGSQLKTIGKKAFYSTPIEVLALPVELESIGEQAFYGIKMSEVTIPASVTSIGGKAFGRDDQSTVLTINISCSSSLAPNEEWITNNNGECTNSYIHVNHTASPSCQVEGNTLTASYSCCNYKPSLQLIASDRIYTGSPIGVSFGEGQEKKWTTYTGSSFVPEIKYVGINQTSYTESTLAPTDAGSYRASITVDQQTAYVDYEIKNQVQEAPAVGTGYTLHYGNETLVATEGYEVSTSNSGLSAIPDSTIVPGNTYYVRSKAKKNYTASEWTAIVVPNRPAAPSGLTAVEPTISGAKDGMLAGVNETMEYKLGTASEWKPVNGTEITGLSAGTIYVRVKKTASSFTGNVATVEIPEGHVHTNAKEKISGKAASCTVDGWKDYYQCKQAGCGKYFADASCTEEITDLETWKVTAGKGKLAATGHSGEKIVGKAASCTVDGWKDYYQCKQAGCGKYFADASCTEEITDLETWKITAGKGKLAATGHSYGDYVSNGDATKTKDGTKSRTCTVCGHVETVSDEGSAIGYTLVEQLVIRMYQNVLNREPDETGFVYWTNALQNGSVDGAAIAVGFFQSNEYQSKNADNATYITDLYHTFFGREADQAGFDHWLKTLNAGESRQYVLCQFVMSSEFSGICTMAGIERGIIVGKETVVKPSLNSFLQRQYEICLNRKGDDGGLVYWAEGLLNSEKTPAEVAKGFLLSDEFQGKNLNENDFLNVLYGVYLGREPDAGGLAYWTEKLQSGITREEIMDGFAGSNEFGNIVSSFGL